MDEFGSHTDCQPLLDIIEGEIRANGRITFRRFMELALYHPHHGYYTGGRPVIGRDGDYFTSPGLSPLFGAMIGRQVADVWRRLDRPARFAIVEPGAGDGTLAADLLRWAARAEPGLRDAIQYTLVERGARPAMCPDPLQGAAAVSWQGQIPADITGCLISNELLDAFPAHLVGVAEGELRELYVTLEGDALAETWGAPSTAELSAYFDALGLRPGEGCRAEVNLDAPRWIAEAAGALRRGLILTLDYGYPAARLYARWRRQGTLLCFSRHTAHDNPYVRVGRQDITAHVDFTSVARAGRDAGLTLAGFTNQSAFLTALGIHDATRPPVGRSPGEEYFARYRATNDLLAPEGLGRVGVLALTRGLDDLMLRGFDGAPDPHVALFGADGAG
ncbi:MAG: SAM-dependent methyltransferase [Dehalococcoidia bacterium]